MLLMELQSVSSFLKLVSHCELVFLEACDACVTQALKLVSLLAILLPQNYCDRLTSIMSQFNCTRMATVDNMKGAL